MDELNIEQTSHLPVIDILESSVLYGLDSALNAARWEEGGLATKLREGPCNVKTLLAKLPMEM